MNTDQINQMFFLSSISDGNMIDTGSVLTWLNQKKNDIKVEVLQISLEELNGWIFDDCNIRHSSSHFFSIDGIRINTNYGLVSSWCQPIINQPEIGFLGMITKKIDGVLYFLVQAKIEPGNINHIQISPTLQATRSNYKRVHKGKRPLFLEYFNGEKNVDILIDQLQSEQGGRFLRKRNRNIIVMLKDNETIDIPDDNFVWLTLKQIKELLSYDNVVNMDTRTVISCINYGEYDEQVSKDNAHLYSLLNSTSSFYEMRQIINWITGMKFNTDLDVIKIPIGEIDKWRYQDGQIRHIDDKYFSVIGIRTSIENREVVSWDQPMIKPAQEGIIAFIVKKINGTYHFLVQAKMEVGNFDLIELAPTIQCLTGNYRKGYNEYTIPYLDYVQNVRPEQIWYYSYQSEEGGRFFQEQNLNMIIEADDNFDMDIQNNYCWMTLNQLLSFVSYNNYLNIAARSLLAAIRLDQINK